MTVGFTSEGGFSGHAPDLNIPRLPTPGTADWLPRQKRRLPIEVEIDAIFSGPGGTPSDRLAKFLAVDTHGRPGGPAVRERQARTGQRLHPRPAPIRLTPDQWRQKQAARRERGLAKRAETSGDASFAFAVAESFHKHVKSLYTSKRAGIRYGHGGANNTDWDAYSKRYGFPANWKDAGVRVEYPAHGPSVAIIETSRGTEVARVQLPAKRDRKNIVFCGLVDGDLWAVRRVLCGVEIWRRFGLRRKQIVETGFTVWVRIGTTPDGKAEGYYEHGLDLSQIKAEIRHKDELRRRAAEVKVLSQREMRLARLVAVLCGRLVVTYDDARACGYCAAGIGGFQVRYGLGDRTEATVAELRATRDAQAERPIMVAALRLAKERLAPASRN